MIHSSDTPGQAPVLAKVLSLFSQPWGWAIADRHMTVDARRSYVTFRLQKTFYRYQKYR